MKATVTVKPIDVSGEFGYPIGHEYDEQVREYEVPENTDLAYMGDLNKVLEMTRNDLIGYESGNKYTIEVEFA